LWGFYNEPNGGFWRPKPDATEYTTLALATARAIREAEPSATIIAPAMSGFDWKYMESFLQSGVLEFLDGVSVHPYRDPNRPPEANCGFERPNRAKSRIADAYLGRWSNRTSFTSPSDELVANWQREPEILPS
jgi:hypothetical protein